MYDFTSQPQESPKPVYTVADTVYAWISLLMAFLFRQTVPVATYPTGGFLLILTLFVSGFVILRVKKQKLYPVCIFTAVSAFVISAALLLTDAQFLIDLSMTYCLASYCYFLYAAFGNRIEQGLSDYIYIDFVRMLLVLPFRSIGAIFPALANKSAAKGSRFLLRIFAGIAIAVIPTLLVLIFLSYDAGFREILDKMFSFDDAKIGRTIVSLIYTLPLAMYGFGLYASANLRLLQDKDAESCDQRLQKTKILPQITALVAVLPILFLYVVFFISQWKYYVSGFTSVLPENFSYAEYARQGFFELCSVSVINLLIIVAMAFFIKRNKNGISVILKIVAPVFCICTLILISTAIAKLIMYIDCYGLTQKRIYAMWLMMLIGIVFIVIALGQCLRRFKAVAVSLIVAILLFSGLSVCNVNALCANYNVDRYLSGSLETLDIPAMRELGDSAVPALVRALNAMDDEKDPELKKDIRELLKTKYYQYRSEESSVFTFSFPSAMAKSALQEYTADIFD